ncbi:WD repeat-containing protein slp1 [Entamoeba marina]
MKSTYLSDLASLFPHSPLSPHLFLDVPGVIDDYYLNLIKWNNKHQLVVALSDVLYLWNSDTGDAFELFKCSNDDLLTTYISSVNFIDDTKTVFGDFFGVLRVVDCQSGKLIYDKQHDNDRIDSIATYGNLIATGSRDNNVFVMDIRIGNKSRTTFEGHYGEVCGIDFSSNGNYLATGANDNNVFVFDLRMNRSLFNFQHDAAVKAVKFNSQRENILATGGGSTDKRIKITNVATKEQPTNIITSSQVTGIVWCPNELMISHGYPSNSISFYDCEHWNRTGTFDGHDGRILGLTATNDGLAATIGADEMIRIWKLWDIPSEHF